MRIANHTWLRLILFITLVGVILWVGINYRDQLELTRLNHWIKTAGIWAPLLFITFYILAVVLFLPGAGLTIAGGFIFGPFYGVLFNFCGAMIGSTLAFLIARYLASRWVAEKAAGRAKQIIAGVEREGWKFVAITRLVPIVPFNLLNYALGITRIRFVHYVIASAVCMLPGTIAYTYVGSLGQTALAGQTKDIVTQALITIGLLVLVGSMPWIIRQIRNGKKQS